MIEIQNVRDVADDAGILNHPLLQEIGGQTYGNQVVSSLKWQRPEDYLIDDYTNNNT